MCVTCCPVAWATDADRPTTRSIPSNGSFTRYPVLSEIAVTYRCNLACTFCYAGCGTSDATPGNAAQEKHRNSWKFWQRSAWWQRRHPQRDPVLEEMTPEEVFRVIDQLATIGKGAQRQLHGRRMHAADPNCLSSSPTRAHAACG